MVETTEWAPPDGERVLVVPLLGTPPISDGVPIREGEVQLMLRQVLDEQGDPHLALLAFSTVTRLVEAMGEAQPWAAIPAAELGPALEGSGAEAVVVDPVVTGG